MVLAQHLSRRNGAEGRRDGCCFGGRPPLPIRAGGGKDDQEQSKETGRAARHGARITALAPEYHKPVQQRFSQRVLRYLREQRLLKAGDRVGVAVSGGPDSVALLRVLLELRPELGIVVAAVGYFHPKLRGSHPQSDERFVRALAEKFDLQFLRAEADTSAAAAAGGKGIESAARELRYEFFGDLLRSSNGIALDAVATGHTLDDQAETVLMRLIRGAG